MGSSVVLPQVLEETENADEHAPRCSNQRMVSTNTLHMHIWHPVSEHDRFHAVKSNSFCLKKGQTAWTVRTVKRVVRVVESLVMISDLKVQKRIESSLFGIRFCILNLISIDIEPETLDPVNVEA